MSKTCKKCDGLGMVWDGTKWEGCSICNGIGHIGSSSKPAFTMSEICDTRPNSEFTVPKCPDCGSDNVRIADYYSTFDDYHTYRVECNNCNCNTGGEYYRGKGSAVQEWIRLCRHKDLSKVESDIVVSNHKLSFCEWVKKLLSR